MRILAFVVGLALVAATLASAIRTFVLPRSARDGLSQLVFRLVRVAFSPWTRRARTYAERDRAMALYAPVALLALLPAWLVVVQLGYLLMYWAVDLHALDEDFVASGSALLTLGFARVDSLPVALLSFSEATIGLLMVALLIAYLPTMYAAFSRRETAITLLEVRAGSPPSAVEMLLRYNRIHGLDQLSLLWTQWEVWFAEVEESHTSLAALAFFRSPHPDRSWVTAAGAVLDAASLALSVVEMPRSVAAQLCIRAGYLALRRIADFFEVAYNPAPSPDDPISITRLEFDAACEELAARGLRLKDDRDQAWRDFNGWRVNYDTVLLALAELTMAPYAPWSSDRGLMKGKRKKKA